jgi:hypothetical protein
MPYESMLAFVPECSCCLQRDCVAGSSRTPCRSHRGDEQAPTAGDRAMQVELATAHAIRGIADFRDTNSICRSSRLVKRITPCAPRHPIEPTPASKPNTSPPINREPEHELAKRPARLPYAFVPWVIRIANDPNVRRPPFGFFPSFGPWNCSKQSSTATFSYKMQVRGPRIPSSSSVRELQPGS